MMKLVEALKMRSQCIKLVRQRNQAGGVKSGHLEILMMMIFAVIRLETYLRMLLVMRNSAQLMRSLGRWQIRNTMTIQTRIPARFIS